MAGQTPLLSVHNLSVSFRALGRSLAAVRHLCFDVMAGEITALVGESGCGKSLTLRALLRLPPENAELSGEVFFQGQDLMTLSERELMRLRGRAISMIFQEPMTALNPVLTVGEQAAEVLTTHLGLSFAEAKGRVLKMFTQVGIPEAEARFQSYPHQLSGGMRQRVMIAMSLLCDPLLLLADEPTTALDATIRQQILLLLREESVSRRMAVLFISHDLDVVESMAQAVGVMYAGTLVEWGRSETLFANPLHPYTQGLLQASPSRMGQERAPLCTIPGTVPPLSAEPRGCPFAPRCPKHQPACFRLRPALAPLANDPSHALACLLCENTSDRVES